MGENLSYVDLGSMVEPEVMITGEEHSCILTRSFEIKCWGRGSDGNLGYGNNGSFLIYSFLDMNIISNNKKPH